MSCADRLLVITDALIPKHEFTALLYDTEREKSWTGDQFSGVKVAVWFQRRHENDLYNIAIVQMALTSLVAGVWTMEPENRLEPDFTLVLAGVAMKFVIAETLPPVSYVTLLEKYINITFLFLTLATVAHCLQDFVEGVVCDPDTVCHLDSMMFGIWVVPWIATNVISLAWLRHVKEREVDLVKQLGLTKSAEAGGDGKRSSPPNLHLTLT